MDISTNTETYTAAAWSATLFVLKKFNMFYFIVLKQKYVFLKNVCFKTSPDH